MIGRRKSGPLRIEYLLSRMIRALRRFEPPVRVENRLVTVAVVVVFITAALRPAPWSLTTIVREGPNAEIRIIVNRIRSQELGSLLVQL